MAGAAGAPDVASAHAPLSRALAVGPRGAFAVRMPGFGVVLRASDTAPFAYACDALLGLTPFDDRTGWAFRTDGTLLLASPHGLAVVAADACRVEPVARLADVPVVALALSASGKVAYAIAEGAMPAVYRSADGGDTWERRENVPAATGDTALFVDATDTNTIFASRVTGPDASVVLRSTDGGATFVTVEQDLEVVLLHAEPGATGRLWARARTGMGMETALLAGDKDAGAWEEKHRVRFFGGFAVAPDGSQLWVGDEAGGVFRSTDGGEAFDAVAPDVAVACLVYANGALWACTQGTTTQRAVAMFADDGTDFEDVVRFAEVIDPVACPTDVLATEMCAPAWAEWRSDVVGMGGVPSPPPATTDAGLLADAAVETTGADAAPSAEPRRSDDCGVAGGLAPPPSPAAALWLTALVLARAYRRSRVRRGRRAQP